MEQNFNPYHALDGKFCTQLDAISAEPKKKSKKLWEQLAEERKEALNKISEKIKKIK